jgi:hypothetical protein
MPRVAEMAVARFGEALGHARLLYFQCKGEWGYQLGAEHTKELNKDLETLYEAIQVANRAEPHLKERYCLLTTETEEAQAPPK